ncbi:MAG: hypothetical protein C4527_04955 [Candidatus Omnitrophota bacterium]|jgi:hypothetical protein|nr:MAG: hypothetical protein C4527_04955 [Candidatus Omnitrophota bacterium]
MHQTTARFWRCFARLPESVKKIARQNFQLLKTNPSHPSLHFKKVGRFWSIRVGIVHRALAMEDEGGFVWVWIGSHEEYERMIKE